MTEIFTTPKEIFDLNKKNNFEIIGIDGGDGVGKTTLADFLANEYGFSVINLDKFVNSVQGGFIDQIKLDELKEAVSSAKRPLIIEGCCLLEVMEKTEINIDCHIYFKRLCHGIWSEKGEYEVHGTLMDHIKKQNDFCKELARLEATQKNEIFIEDDDYLLPLTKDLYRYHFNYTPYTRANFIYERECSSS